MTVSLGIPAMPPPVLAPRRATRQIDVGGVLVGGGAPISVQSMTTTVTADVNATLQQIAELTATGCQIVRVAVPDPVDADALAEIVRHSQLPVIADIHFQSKYIFKAIDAGCAAVRVNPGNIREFDGKVGEVARAARESGKPIRIGVPDALAARATSPTLPSNSRMLPGLTRTAAQPASMALKMYLLWKWMSAMTGSWLC